MQICFHFIKIDGKSNQNYYELAGKMETKTSSPTQTPQTHGNDNVSALSLFLSNASLSPPIRVTDFLNSTTPENRENPLFIPNGGILHGKDNKGNRDILTQILQEHGAQVQGETPATKIVVFPQDFQRVIPEIVERFLSNLGLVSSAKPVATGGGGAALPEPDSSLVEYNLLERWLYHISSGGSPILRQNLFNQTSEFNTAFTELFANGFLSDRPSRDLLMTILISNGVGLQGNHPKQYVVFPPNFQKSVLIILDAFIVGLLRSLENDDKPLVQSVPVATGGGGAALHKSTHQSKSHRLTLEEFQKTQKKHDPNDSEDKTLECVVCPHTNNDSSGTCCSSSCDLFHPINPKSVKVSSQRSESGEPFISARICCHHSTRGQCRLGDGCRFAHLSSNEYKRFQTGKVQKNHQDEPRQKIQNSKPIVPSQVHFGRQSHSGTPVHNFSNQVPHAMEVHESKDSPLSDVKGPKQIQNVVDVEGTAELGSERLQGSETDRIIEEFRSLTDLDQIAEMAAMVANRVRK